MGSMLRVTDRYLYKLLNHVDAIKAETDGYTDTALDGADGYVHLSGKAQVATTAALHYRGQAGVILLEFDATSIGGEIRWEASRGGELFPHLYGRLEIGRATRRWTLDLGSDGTPQMPDDL